MVNEHSVLVVDPGTLKLAGKCPACGKPWELTVSVDSYRQWIGGTFVQDAFPELDASQRELLVSGICDPCFEEITRES